MGWSAGLRHAACLFLPRVRGLKVAVADTSLTVPDGRDTRPNVADERRGDTTARISFPVPTFLQVAALTGLSGEHFGALVRRRWFAPRYRPDTGRGRPCSALGLSLPDRVLMTTL